MTSLLKSRDLWQFCESNIKCEDDTSEDGTFEIVRKNEEAKHLIYCSLEPEQITTTGTCETAFNLWEKLKENFEGAETSMRNNSLAEFLGLKYQKGESIITFSGRFELALGRLQSTGYPVLEDTKLWVYRNSLPKELQAIVNTWAIARPAGLVSELISQMKIQYHLEKLELDDAQAFVAQPNQRDYNNQKNRQKFIRPSKQTVPNNDEKKVMFCTYCKRKNHTWKECRKLKAKQAADNSDSKASTSAEKKVYAFVANQADKTDRSAWIIDSGASCHMTNNRAYLTNYKPIDREKFVTVGNGERIRAVGQGDILFDSDGISGILYDVLLVPELHSNLFSIRSTSEQGNEAEFSQESPYVSVKRNGCLLLQGYQDEGTYKLNLSPHLNQQADDHAEVSLTEWHGRFNHCSKDMIKSMAKENTVQDLKISNKPRDTCSNCVRGKICRSDHPLRRESHRATKPGEVVHFDTCGPLPFASLGGSRYFVLAIDEFSDYKFIECVSAKSQVADAVKRIINRLELASKASVKSILSDNGTEYVNTNLRDWLNSRGILHEKSAVYTPEQNGKVERANRTVLEGVRTMLDTLSNQNQTIVQDLWAEAANCFIHTHNRTPKKSSPMATRYEKLFNRVPSVAHLRTFGEMALVKNPGPQKNSKLASKARKVVFVGYGSRSNTYRFYDPETKKILQSCDVVFVGRRYQSDETNAERFESPWIPARDDNRNITIHSEESRRKFQNDSKSSSHKESTDGTHNLQQPEEVGTSLNHGSLKSTSTDEPSEAESESGSRSHTSEQSSLDEIAQIPTMTGREKRSNFTQQEPSHRVLRSDARRKQPTALREEKLYARTATFTLKEEPKSVKEAMNFHDWPNWQMAIKEEIDALEANKTWMLVPRTPQMRLIKSKWVFKRKEETDGTVRFKARLVAQGFSQIENIDYKQTYSPVASMVSIRIFLSIANSRNMDLCQFDVKTAFLNGELKEKMYMQLPDNYQNDGRVCELRKSIYGLKQSPRNWNLKFISILKDHNLTQSEHDPNLFYDANLKLLLIIYVDDGLIASTDRKLMDELLKHLQRHLKIKVLECETYVGLQIIRNRKLASLKIVQSRYAEALLERFKMHECNSVPTPETSDLELDESPTLKDPNGFKELVGCLLYLVTGTRPDIAHALSVASRTGNPTEAHLNALKRILRYIKGTTDLGIEFSRAKGSKLIGFSDSDYANDRETRRSTSGYCVLYGGGPIVWKCQRQNIVTLSTTEAEFVAGCDLVKELIPIRKLLVELGELEDHTPTSVFIDNQSTIKIAVDEQKSHRTKHIDVRSKWLSEQQSAGKISIKHIESSKQCADMLTKRLSKPSFVANRNLLMASILILTLCTLCKAALPRVNPLFFAPTSVLYLEGKQTFHLRYTLQSPCHPIMSKVTANDTINDILNGICESEFKGVILTATPKCEILSPNMQEPLPVDRSIVLGAKTMEEQRERENIPRTVISTRIGEIEQALLFQNPESSHTYLQNIDALKHVATNNFTALNLDASVRANADAIWISRLKEYRFTEEELSRAVSALTTSSAYLGSYRKALNLIERARLRSKVPTDISRLAYPPLWEPFLSEYSTLHNCSARVEETSLSIYMNFTIPKRQDRVKVLQAVSFNFYNNTLTTKGTDMSCWMTYTGPDLVMFNETNNCMIEISEWQISGGFITNLNCTNPSTGLKISETTPIWSPTFCVDEPKRMHRAIQIKRLSGLERIYCYKFNITIEGKEYSCPDYVFEVLEKDTYSIGELKKERSNPTVTMIKSSDLHLNKLILSTLKVDSAKLRATGPTQWQVSISRFKNQIMSVKDKLVSGSGNILDGISMPEGVPLNDLTNLLGVNKLESKELSLDTVLTVAAQPLTFIWEKFDLLWQIIRIGGIILGIFVITSLFIILIPFIHLVISGINIVKIPFNAWMKLANNAATNLTRLITTKTRITKKSNRFKYKQMV